MTTLRLPGLIDPHVHLREPGATHKEDFDTGTAAALAGGFTCILDMPNNQPPITDAATLQAKQAAARIKARCDYGLYLGAGVDNIPTAATLTEHVVGLKCYLDQTYGPLRLDTLEALIQHAERWPRESPLLVHAEGRSMAAAILVAQLTGARLHICHVSRAEEIDLIRRARDKGLAITCEATPHHLFLTAADAATIGAGRSEVRPRLADARDRAALRACLVDIDCFATDHAPHTAAEKDGANPPPGFPGLETALPLYLELVREGLLTLDELVVRTVHNPRRIFNLPEQPDTWIEVDAEAEWVVRGAELHTRARWSPFEGRHLRGRVTRVVLRGQLAYENGNVLAPPGSGRDVRALVNAHSNPSEEE